MPKVCTRHVNDMSDIYTYTYTHRYVTDMSKTFPRYVPGKSKVCFRHVPDIFQICPTYDQDMPKICSRHSVDMPRILDYPSSISQSLITCPSLETDWIT